MIVGALHITDTGPIYYILVLYIVYNDERSGLYPTHNSLEQISYHRGNKLGARTLGAHSRGSKNVTYRQQTTDKKVNTEPL